MIRSAGVIEAGGGFVGNEPARACGKRGGEAGTPRHAAGQFVRPGLRTRSREPEAGEERHGSTLRPASRANRAICAPTRASGSSASRPWGASAIRPGAGGAPSTYATRHVRCAAGFRRWRLRSGSCRRRTRRRGRSPHPRAAARSSPPSTVQGGCSVPAEPDGQTLDASIRRRPRAGRRRGAAPRRRSRRRALAGQGPRPGNSATHQCPAISPRGSPPA